MTDFEIFCTNFSIVDNALNMRNLMRWNGRDLRNKENLAEHTHLVVACTIELYDNLPKFLKEKINFEILIKCSMYHDSLELLRGDILSVTKDLIPGLRDWTDNEEEKFVKNLIGDIPTLIKELVKLADLKACYKFVENELKYPSNNFALNIYLDTKRKYDIEYSEFLKKYDISQPTKEMSNCYYSKAYEDDAGVDIILNEDYVFLPHHTCTKSMNISFTPKPNEMAFLCSRTSAAKKGLIVAMSPIDPGYTGNLTAIVHNNSNDIITYKKGESFCQLVIVPTNKFGTIIPRFDGVRADGKLGSTGKC